MQSQREKITVNLWNSTIYLIVGGERTLFWIRILQTDEGQVYSEGVFSKGDFINL